MTDNDAPVAPAAERAAIHYRGVAKHYRGRPVLAGVDFTVPHGSSTAIVGLNGAGKSTLLRCLLDFARPDAGSILVQGRDHADVQARAALAWLPERFVPPAHLTARESLHWLAGLRGAPLDDAAAEATARGVGLAAGALDRRVGELSKGMTQKVGMISVTLSGRPVWVLDEPMSGLDPQARADVARMLAARPPGQTVLFTSHELRDLPRLCDRLVVLRAGVVAYCGSPAGFAERYRVPGGTGAVAAGPDLEASFLACVGGHAMDAAAVAA